MDEPILHSAPQEQQKTYLQPEVGLRPGLSNARVLVVGAGALGCFLLQQLAVAGVGFVGIADGKKVESSGQQHQVLFGLTDAGSLKVKIAAAAISRLHPQVVIKEYPFFIYNVLALKIIPKYDIVVDCTNHLPTRYLLNDACALMQKPMVFGALHQWDGYVGLLHVGRKPIHRGTNYRQLAAQIPVQKERHNQEQLELMSVLPGMVASLQAAEVIKWITGLGQLVQDGFVVYHVSSAAQKFVPVQDATTQDAPRNEHDFLHTNYEWLLGGGEVQEIGMRELKNIMARGGRFIDVREMHEAPALPVPHQRIPLSKLRQEKVQLEGNEVVVVCHLGIRSVEAVRLLSQWAHPGQKLYSLKGGIMTLAAIAETNY